MITETHNSIYNKIIEYVSDLVDTVVQAIATNPNIPDDEPDRPDWKERYPAIEDLRVLTATHVDAYLPASIEYPDRYPAVIFMIDEAIPNPILDDSECFIGRLVMELYVNRENFKMAQREMFEIFDALRSIILHDKSLGVINERGGLIDQIQTLGFTDMIVDRDAARHFILGASYVFEIAFREDYNR